MIFKFKNQLPSSPEKQATILFLSKCSDFPEERSDLVPFKKLIQPVIKSGAFKGDYLTLLPLRLADDNSWLVLVGLGPEENLREAKILEAGALASQSARNLGLKEASLVIPPLNDFPSALVLELLATGARLGQDKRTEYKSKTDNENQELKSITFMGPDISHHQDILSQALIVAEAQIKARRWADQPANQLYPEFMAQEAINIGHQMKLKVTVWNEKKLEQEGAGAILAVGRGSENPPRLVILQYQGGAKNEAPIALVGKGITFDSGGLCLKPAENMAQMKTDMSGSAAVLAVMEAVAALKISKNIIGFLSLAENMPDGRAYRPGDIITTLSGQTVEIINTDAEGRLVLADALTLAQRYNPEKIIDLATLTGACVVALGDKCAGLFSTCQKLSDQIIKAGKDSGETFWPLPLLEDYEEEIKSELADFKQAGARSGGAINAALFLKKFIQNPIPWAHLDIAGTARRNKRDPSGPEGGSGFAVRTLLKLLVSE